MSELDELCQALIKQRNDLARLAKKAIDDFRQFGHPILAMRYQQALDSITNGNRKV